jgi:hypothetical protein
MKKVSIAKTVHAYSNIQYYCRCSDLSKNNYENLDARELYICCVKREQLSDVF